MTNSCYIIQSYLFIVFIRHLDVLTVTFWMFLIVFHFFFRTIESRSSFIITIFRIAHRLVFTGTTFQSVTFFLLQISSCLNLSRL